METTSHLFCECEITGKIWELVYQWLGVDEAQDGNVICHFREFERLTKGTRRKGEKYLIWLAAVWNIWIVRNKVVFKGEVVFISSVLLAIKHGAWRWFKARKGRNCGVSWSDWFNWPMGCLLCL